MEFKKMTYCNILASQCLFFSAVQQSESAICIHISLFWISHLRHHGVQSMVLCAIQ